MMVRAASHCGLVFMGSTPKLTGAGERSAEGTDTAHENAAGMACIGARVERLVRHRLARFLYRH